ncbi:hypothetical protein QIS74_08116 [Colletotrichum tabaci]|uniref:Uncharacterized protein n=1 Tax=Colletotrichum tabaci TaxID=1209068 RepID=A0AAV9T747_9PEZI
MVDKDPERRMVKEAKDLLEMLEDMPTKEPDKASSALAARKLRNIAQVCIAMRDCGDDLAALNRLYN